MYMAGGLIIFCDWLWFINLNISMVKDVSLMLMAMEWGNNNIDYRHTLVRVATVIGKPGESWNLTLRNLKPGKAGVFP